jgi:hypothetical protein
MSYSFFKSRKYKGPKYIIRNKSAKPLSKMSETEKIALAVSLLSRCNAILGRVDLAWLKEKNALDDFNNMRLQISEISRKLNVLTLTKASEIKQEGEKQ